ncbi:MAG: dephospho-CoA kinase [Clostridia bacterium]|nr:dephospho-CoA kinase [Clostridia bacterium]
MKIAITGGIGSGKTVAVSALKKAGIKVVNCDEVVKKLYKNRAFLKELKKIFPDEIKGRIFLKADKKKIAEKAFSDDKVYKLLTETVTERALSVALLRAEKNDLSVVEVPLLFETKAEKYFDRVIVIKRDLKDRIESVKKRSDLSEEEITARIKAQFDYEKKDLSRYIVLENDRGKEELAEKVLAAVASCVKD